MRENTRKNCNGASVFPASRIFNIKVCETAMSTALQNLVNQPYQHGFVTDIEADVAPKGLSEATIRLISGKKNEPEWLLEFRLKAYRQWLTMKEPQWPNVHYPKIDFQAISY